MSSRRQLVGLGALALVATTVPLATGAAEAPPPADDSLVVSGELQSVVVDDFTGGTSRTATTLLLRDGTRLDVVRTPGMPTTGKVTATVATETSDERLTTRSAAGLDVARELVGQPVRLLRPTYVAAPAAAGPTAHRAYVAVLRNLGSFGTVTDDQLRTTVVAATDYWTTEAGTEMPSFTVADVKPFSSSVGCGLENSRAFLDATDEARRELYPNVDFGIGTSNHLVVLVPGECPGSLGLGSIGAGLASGGFSVSVAEDAGAVSTIAHELGHNFSLNHANAQRCDPSGDGCELDEYADVYDVMGFSGPAEPPALSSAHRHALGLLPSTEAEVLRLPGDEASITDEFTLGPRGGGSGIRGLRLVEPETGQELFVDYRTGTGRDAGAYYMSSPPGPITYGSGVTLTSLEANRSTTLLTSVDPGEARASWRQGQTFTNGRGTLTVTVEQIGSGIATVVATLATSSVPFRDPVSPVIKGSPYVGQSLGFRSGGWPPGTRLEPRWMVDGEPAPFGDAFGSLLYLYRDYLDATIRLEVTARREGYRAVTVRSAAVGPVTSGPAMITTSRPTISGRPVVGGRLRARPGRWTPGTEFSYQWRAGRRVVRGATGARLRLVRAHRGQRITVRVTGSKRGYRTERRTSAPTRPVRR